MVDAPPALRSPTSARASLLNGPLVLTFGIAFGALTSFYLLLAVSPLHAVSTGAGDDAAGLTTAVMMIATVPAELGTPRLLARLGYRPLLAVGLVLLGAPALALLASSSLLTIVAVAALRGVGFGLVVVAATALVALQLPPERRSEGLGLYGVVVGVPAVVALPAGVWIAERVGFSTVFVAAAASSLVALCIVPGLARFGSAATPRSGLRATLNEPAVVWSAFVFGVTALAAGAVVTFLPLVVDDAGIAALALFLQAIAATVSRWWAGRHADRTDPGRLVRPAVMMVAVGVVCFAMTSTAAAVLVGAVIFGAGFGISQNATLTVMYARASSADYPAVGALWNIAFDAGLGAGAAGFGLLAAVAGYRTAFAATAALTVSAIALTGSGRSSGDAEPFGADMRQGHADEKAPRSSKPDMRAVRV